MASKKEKVAIVSAFASGSLAIAKFVVGIAIGSLALISDALHSLIDLGATLVTWFAVRVSDRPAKGMVFIPFHYREAAVNALTSAVLDPVSKIPELKVCAVKIEPIVVS